MFSTVCPGAAGVSVALTVQGTQTLEQTVLLGAATQGPCPFTNQCDYFYISVSMHAYMCVYTGPVYIHISMYTYVYR